MHLPRSTVVVKVVAAGAADEAAEEAKPRSPSPQNNGGGSNLHSQVPTPLKVVAEVNSMKA